MKSLKKQWNESRETWHLWTWWTFLLRRLNLWIADQMTGWRSYFQCQSLKVSRDRRHNVQVGTLSCTWSPGSNPNEGNLECIDGFTARFVLWIHEVLESDAYSRERDGIDIKNANLGKGILAQLKPHEFIAIDLVTFLSQENPLLFIQNPDMIHVGVVCLV